MKKEIRNSIIEFLTRKDIRIIYDIANITKDEVKRKIIKLNFPRVHNMPILYYLEIGNMRIAFFIKDNGIRKNADFLLYVIKTSKSGIYQKSYAGDVDLGYSGKLRFFIRKKFNDFWKLN